MTTGGPKLDSDIVRLYGKTSGYIFSKFIIKTIDVDLIKCVMIKDFHNFTNRNVFILKFLFLIIVFKFVEWL